MTNCAESKFGFVFPSSTNRNEKKSLIDLLPFNFDTFIFITLFSYLHCNSLCLLGYCYEHRDYKKHHTHEVSIASVIYIIAAAVLSSQFRWWPKELGPTPNGIINILYKVWVGILLHNFAEQLIWQAIYEVTSCYLDGLAEFLAWIAEKLNLENSQLCFWTYDFLTSNTAHSILLMIISGYVFYRVMNSNGFVTSFKKAIFGNQSKRKSKGTSLPVPCCPPTAESVESTSIEPRGDDALPDPTNMRTKSKCKPARDYDNTGHPQNRRARRRRPTENSSHVMMQYEDLFNSYNQFDSSETENANFYYHPDIIPSHPYEDHYHCNNYITAPYNNNLNGDSGCINIVYSDDSSNGSDQQTPNEDYPSGNPHYAENAQLHDEHHFFIHTNFMNTQPSHLLISDDEAHQGNKENKLYDVNNCDYLGKQIKTDKQTQCSGPPQNSSFLTDTGTQFFSGHNDESFSDTRNHLNMQTSPEFNISNEHSLNQPANQSCSLQNTSPNEPNPSCSLFSMQQGNHNGLNFEPCHGFPGYTAAMSFPPTFPFSVPMHYQDQAKPSTVKLYQIEDGFVQTMKKKKQKKAKQQINNIDNNNANNKSYNTSYSDSDS